MQRLATFVYRSRALQEQAAKSGRNLGLDAPLQCFVALQWPDSLPAFEARVRVAHRAQIDPDIVWAQLVPIHINLMNEQKKISVLGLKQFLVTAGRAMSGQAGGRGRVVSFVANLDSHG